MQHVFTRHNLEVAHAAGQLRDMSETRYAELLALLLPNSSYVTVQQTFVECRNQLYSRVENCNIIVEPMATWGPAAYVAINDNFSILKHVCLRVNNKDHIPLVYWLSLTQKNKYMILYEEIVAEVQETPIIPTLGNESCLSIEDILLNMNYSKWEHPPIMNRWIVTDTTHQQQLQGRPLLLQSMLQLCNKNEQIRQSSTHVLFPVQIVEDIIARDTILLSYLHEYCRMRYGVPARFSQATQTTTTNSPLTSFNRQCQFRTIETVLDFDCHLEISLAGYRPATDADVALPHFNRSDMANRLLDNLLELLADTQRQAGGPSRKRRRLNENF